MPAEGGAAVPGQLIGPLEVGPIAHGGHWVARHEGRVVFVRHALAGERVMVRLTDTSHASFWRGDAVEVLEPSPHRVSAPCPIAHRCGGCDLQHVDPAAQSGLKTQVLRDQLTRLSRVEPALVEAVEVEPVEPVVGWRTRMQYRTARDADGRTRVGLRAHRSHEVVPLPDHGCLIAAPGPSVEELVQVAEAHQAEVVQVVAADPPTVLADRQVIRGADVVAHAVLGRRDRVRADGFWQVHPRAAEVLVGTVLRMLEPRPGERALDLYCGVGLFAGALVDAGAEVVGVETSRSAVALARENVPEARFIAAPLERALARLPRRVDLVVLDPPRAGAGAKVVRHVAGLGARAIVHVGCDPASFARDLGLFERAGYRTTQLRAFDLFGMTHHFESVALLQRM